VGLRRKGMASRRFPRARRRRRKLCEHPFLTYADALLLLYELADKKDPRYGTAAARWHAKFVLEASLPLGESHMVMEMFCGVTGARRQIVRRQLLGAVERAGMTARDVAA
jgi:hypothetical protein